MEFDGFNTIFSIGSHVSSTLLLLIVFLFICSTYIHRKRRRSVLLAKIPTLKVPFWQVLGHTQYSVQRRLAYRDQPYSFLVYDYQFVRGYVNLFRKHGLCLLWTAVHPNVIVFRADTVKAILNHSTEIRKAWFYRYFHDWLGTGLLTSEGTKWKQRRKLLTPTFHFDILKEFLPVINANSLILVDVLQKETNKSWISIIPYITRCSLDIICETTLGVKVNSQIAEASQYVKAVKLLSEEIPQRIVSPWYWNDLLFRFTKFGRRLFKNIRIVHEFTRKVIAKKKEEKIDKTKIATANENDSLKQGPVYRSRKRIAFLDFLLEEYLNNKTLSEEGIREEVDTFTFEGHDTTSMGMSWAVYLIGLYPEVQTKLREELNSIFGNDRERPVTMSDLAEMKYLECILKESQRLYPSVPVIGRELIKDLEIQGYTIPAGSSCNVFTHELHMDPEVFPNPEKFDPDRFLPENSDGRDHFAYVPFSAGPRNCIGQRLAMMEEKAVLATLFRNYSIQSLDQRDQIQVVHHIILRSEKPIRVKLQSL